MDRRLTVAVGSTFGILPAIVPGHARSLGKSVSARLPGTPSSVGSAKVSELLQISRSSGRLLYRGADGDRGTSAGEKG